MALDSKHPQYIARYEDWVMISHVYEGERKIKEEGLTYLPATRGMIEDGMVPGQRGYQNYIAYKTRAVFHNYFADALSTQVGIMHKKPPIIELPKELEPMRNSATPDGESLELLLRKINEAQLKDGRVGLLLDVPSGQGPSAMPYIALYSASRIINWDTGRREQGLQKLEFVVLDETENVRNSDLQWELVKKYRALMLYGTFATAQDIDQNPVTSGTYITGVSRDNETDLAGVSFLAPSIAGRTLDSIPFVFINDSDMVSAPGKPPLIGLASLSLSIYRGEGDYRMALSEQAQETLVIIGAGEGAEEEGSDTRVGAGAKIEVPPGGDAKYIGVSAEGLSEMRQALENDKDFAQQQGSRMLSTKGGDQQSGDALRTRVAAQTASLPLMANTAAEALAAILRIAAAWKGADASKVSVKPNLDFTADEMTGQNLLQIMQAKQMGAPLSTQSIHAFVKDKGMTSMGYEEEIALIEEEQPLVSPTGGRGVDDPTLGGGDGNSQ